MSPVLPLASAYRQVRVDQRHLRVRASAFQELDERLFLHEYSVVDALRAVDVGVEVCLVQAQEGLLQVRDAHWSAGSTFVEDPENIELVHAHVLGVVEVEQLDDRLRRLLLHIVLSHAGGPSAHGCLSWSS